MLHIYFNFRSDRDSLPDSNEIEKFLETKNLNSRDVILIFVETLGDYTQATISLDPLSGSVIHGAKLFLAHDRFDYESSSSYPKEIISASDFKNLYGDFVLFLHFKENYQKVISRLGEDHALSFLLAINDISALNMTGTKTTLLNRVRRNPQFVDFLQIDSEAYLSFMSLERILAKRRAGYGPQPEALNFIADTTEESCLDFSFDFKGNKKGPSLINALIGPNGVGKTRATVNFAQQASQARSGDWPASVCIYSHDVGAYKGQVPKNVALRTMNPSYKNWMKVTKLFSKLIFNHSDRGRGLEVLSRLFSEIISLDDLYLPINTNPYSYIGLEGIIFGVNESYASIASCMKYSSQHLTPLLFREDLPPQIMIKGRLVAPSSGEIALFAFMVSILVECDNGSLILIDEPENHLHPKFISLFMGRLADLLLDTDSLAIVVTHSPFVVRELDKSAVTIMQKNEDETILFRPGFQTHGGNVALISHYVFGDEDIRKNYQDVVDKLVNQSDEISNSKDQVERIGTLMGNDALNYFISKGNN